MCYTNLWGHINKVQSCLKTEQGERDNKDVKRDKGDPRRVINTGKFSRG